MDNIKKIEDRVRALCKKWGCPKQDETDVVQEVHLLMLEKPERKVDTATSIAIRRVCRGLAVPAPLIVDETTPAQLAEEREEHEQMMARLAPRDREVAGLLEDGYTIGEIAAKTGVTYDEVARRLRFIDYRYQVGDRLGWTHQVRRSEGRKLP